MLRTKEPLTEAQQDAFYDQIVAGTLPHLYVALEHKGQFIGLGGLTHLTRTAGEAEISLILGPEFRGKGYGSAAVDLLLGQARSMRLKAVIGECYAQGNRGFWRKEIREQTGCAVHSHEVSGGPLTWRWTL